MNPHVSRFFFALFAILLVAGCGFESAPDDVRDHPGYRQRVFHLQAPCDVNVEGVGMVDIDEYIPGVVACENGSAPPEALKAQAVQARSFLYYKLFVAGATTIKNSQADQVYSCSYRPNGPGPEHYAAHEATKGQYLTWNGSIVASFYVAGAIPPNPDPSDAVGSCRGDGGSDPTSTENWVTYNWGKSDCNSSMTNLGWTPADCNDNPHNRGCASQNGEACLADLGWHYQDMLKYYYGDDIVLVSADGNCGGPPPKTVDDFDRFCGGKADGSYCMDAATAVTCADGYAMTNDNCMNGCEQGACTQESSPCDGLADGSHCVSQTERIECQGGDLTLTEMCPNGCDGTTCAAETSNNGTTNNGTTNNGGTNNGGTSGNNGVSGNNGTSQNNGTSGIGPGGTNSEEFPPLVHASRGQSGGCSSAPADAPTGAPLMMLGFGLLWMGRRRRR